MVDFLNDDVTFKGKVTTEEELLVEGGLTIGAGGVSLGDSISSPATNWQAQTRVQVADTTERAALAAWRAAHAPISSANPLLVWRANGSLTGVNEITVDGTNWYAETPLAGDIEMTMAAAAPYGWLLCQGQVLANAAANYPALWAAASPAYRAGSSLRLPDLRGRAPIGAGEGPSLTLRNLGDLLGAEGVILTENQLAAHDHAGETANPDRSLNHRHTSAFGTEEGSALGGSGVTFYTTGGFDKDTSLVTSPSSPSAGSNLNHHHTFTTDSAGANEAHPNVQPSAVVNFKVKI